VRVVRPATQSRWIRYARQVTVRRLEEVVVECEVNADPLPPADSLRDATTAAPLDDAGRHTSAPPTTPGGIHMNGYDRLSRRRIFFWCPLAVASLWESALRSCRAAAGQHLEDWECFLLLVRSLRETWENQEDAHWRRRYRIFERDGWRCKAPGCSSRSGLNEHHIIFRSRQGEDDPENLVTLCVGHHQAGVHDNRIRCIGNAPDGLWWDLGVRPGREPLARYFGDRIVRGRPFVSIASPARPSEAATGVARTGFCKPSAPRGIPVADAAPRTLGL
jgi:HNH endonuclease